MEKGGGNNNNNSNSGQWCLVQIVLIFRFEARIVVYRNAGEKAADNSASENVRNRSQARCTASVMRICSAITTSAGISFQWHGGTGRANEFAHAFAYREVTR